MAQFGKLRTPPISNLRYIVMAEQTPELLDSKKVFAGRVIDVTVDTVREGGRTYTREVVRHHGSAVIDSPRRRFPRCVLSP